MKAYIRKNFFKPSNVDALIIWPDCACLSPIALQLEPSGEYEAFKFDGNTDAPTVTHYSDPKKAGSVAPPASRCSPGEEGGKGCHFTVRNGIAYHRDDSKYAGKAVPLKAF